MANRSKIKKFIQFILFLLFSISALLLDTLSFSWACKPLIQLLLCSYIILLAKQRSQLFIVLTIIMLALESALFFGQIEYSLFFALLAYVSTQTLNELIHIPIAIPIITLNLVLIVQKLFSILYLQHHYYDFLYTIGHFGINNIVLIMYWIFENNGKQGNRS